MARFSDNTVDPVRILKNSRGQTLVEYGLLLILIAVVVIGVVTVLGQKLDTKYSTISTSLP
jgi:pilus assembly protein Flp/PilA